MEGFPVRGCRDLIAAILDQALNDMKNIRGITLSDKLSAIRFVDKNNELFCYYCNLLGYDPECIADKMHESAKLKKIHIDFNKKEKILEDDE